MAQPAGADPRGEPTRRSALLCLRHRQHPGPAVTRQQPALERRQQLLEAALGVAAERGLARMRIDDVGRAARLSKGAVYWHFRNKDALIEGLFSHVIDREFDCWRDLPEAGPSEMLAAAVAALGERFAGETPLATVRRLCLGEPGFHLHRRPWRRDLQTLLVMLSGLGRPSAPPARIRADATILLATIEGLLLQPAQDDMPPGDVVSALTDRLFRAD